jgi:hypothetical protein
MFSEALAETEKWRDSDDTPVWEMQAYVYGRAGQQEQARSALAKWERLSRRRKSPPAAMLLMAYASMGNRDGAFALLEQAFREHSNILTTLKVEPGYAPLRSDQRFQDLLRRVGLADSGVNEGSTQKR